MKGTDTGSDLRTLATRYIEAVGKKDFDTVASFLNPQMEFTGNIAASRGAGEWIAALRRLSPVLLRNEVKKVFVDGSEVCIIYDFVTTVCPVPSVEWLVIKDDLITSIFLLFDRSRWPEVMEALKAR